MEGQSGFYSPMQAKTIETPYYKAQVRDDGEIVSIVHVPSNMELLDPQSPGLFNQYLYETFDKVEGVGWHDSGYAGPGPGRVMPKTSQWRLKSGPLATRLIRGRNTPHSRLPGSDRRSGKGDPHGDLLEGV